jgi:hypothetical protein
MARQELHSDQMPKPEQMPPISDAASYDGDVVLTERTHNQDYLDELAFMEDPITIRLEPSAERNAAKWLSIWCNGRGAEVLVNGQWLEFKHLPVSQVLTTKRKYVEIIIRAKVDTVTTPDMSESADRAEMNRLERFTTPIHSFSILEDRNPKGPAWMAELRRRNL